MWKQPEEWEEGPCGYLANEYRLAQAEEVWELVSMYAQWRLNTTPDCIYTRLSVCVHAGGRDEEA